MITSAMFYLTIIGIILFILGKYYRDPSIGFLGGLTILTIGLNTIINPITSISTFMSIGIGTILWGLGGYIVVVGGLEMIEG